MTARIGCVILALLLGGCVSDDSGPVRSVFRPSDSAYVQASTVYVTDRALQAGMPGGFANAWGDAPSCGSVDVALPPARIAGEESKWGYIAKTHPKPCADRDGPLGAVAKRIAAEAKAKGCHSVFLFVHGFHTGFDGATLRAAQLAHDTQTNCVAAAFAWTSVVQLDKYAVDLERSAFAQPLLDEFLRVLADSGLRVRVLAHSVGARLTLGALSAFKYRHDAIRPGFIDELVLAAPDIGVAAGDSDLAKLLADAIPYVKRTTIYASANDTVMALSKSAHGGIPRAGGTPTATSANADVIDASDPPADFLDHSYYGMSFEAIYDLTMVLHGVSLDDRLKANGPWPATLTRKDGRLALATQRDQRTVTEILIFLAPLLPY